MNLFDWLLRKKWIKCTRCLGKDHVDLGDIERLQRELYWLPGKCAYCKGRGRVSPEMPESVQPDLAYLQQMIQHIQQVINNTVVHSCISLHFIYI